MRIFRRLTSKNGYVCLFPNVSGIFSSEAASGPVPVRLRTAVQIRAVMLGEHVDLV